MRRLGLIAAVLLLAGAAACGGGDTKEEGQVRANSGLGVAFAAQAGSRAADRGAAAESPDGGGGAPAVDGGGDAGPEIALQTTSGGLAGITVLGYGMASATADSAIVEFYFSTGAVVKPDVPADSGSGSSGSERTQTTAATSIKESDLQVVIDAIVAQGVSRDDVEFIGGSYYDPYYSSATLRVTTKDMAKLGAIIQAATNAAATLSGIALQGSYVSYTLSDCTALEREALQAAKQDAEARADVLADVLGVGRGGVSAASTYSYSTYGGTACDSSGVAPYPIGGVTYAEGQPSQVQLSASITVTYEIQ
jgi:uncharacterized protein YggE